jgi:uncharacterized membrane protein
LVPTLEKLTGSYLVVAAAGIGLAIYVTIDYLTQNFNSCNINQVFNCGGVYQSGHTSLFGIPFYVMGLAWFPAVFAIGLLTSRFGKRPVNSEILLPILMLGNIFTAYLWYLELAVIHIICPLCVSLYVVNYALTLIVLVLLFREPSVSNPDLEGEATAGVVGSKN